MKGLAEMTGNNLGKQIKLSGISQKGKNRIRELGESWVVLAETEHVLFKIGYPGPWLFIAPPGKGQDDRSSRWIHGSHDPDFQIVV
jgi:hypothetical protein